MVIERDIISEIQKLRNLKRICLTRRTFGGIPNMKMKIDEIKSYCLEKQIPFLLLTTPSRFYNQSKQTEWTAFFNNEKCYQNEFLNKTATIEIQQTDFRK